ncbi:M20 family metallopeptidase [Planctomyces sp. SH-PL62]|uniref:M20 metallopeptidase family protein n=1 Tax=Planctomyces sp. SH-PL62 TaxID=1636152 RepID=UPI00078C23DD|nr:amidohydrolase [Planctomyces sp. SH-PL62]AMV39868.1 putative hydrolase YxeP [Planctomyces sp. SH-PL62]
MPDWRDSLDRWLDSNAERMRSVRRHLHSHPEPSREEYQTARFLAERLDEAGVPYSFVPSRRGILAGTLDSSRPLAAFRADIDALPITDAKDAPYRSHREGVMHACGHDAHAAMALGAAEALWACRDTLPKPDCWRVVFQPAEEVGEGAREMVAAGAMEGVRAVTALHVDPERPVGRVGCRRREMTAFCQELRVVVRGVGGHAARPHQASDPLLAAAQFITTVYQAIPRSVDARDPTVVTFGSLQAGSGGNVIPEEAVIRGTIRTLTRQSSQRVAERLKQIADGLGAATETIFSLALSQSTDGVFNDPAVTAVCTGAAAEILGAGNVEEIRLPSMGGEDFSGYLETTPGCLLRLGVASPGVTAPHLHSPLFDIDERALTLGAKILARSAVLMAEAFAGARDEEDS